MISFEYVSICISDKTIDKDKVFFYCVQQWYPRKDNSYRVRFNNKKVASICAF